MVGPIHIRDSPKAHRQHDSDLLLASPPTKPQRTTSYPTSIKDEIRQELEQSSNDNNRDAEEEEEREEEEDPEEGLMANSSRQNLDKGKGPLESAEMVYDDPTGSMLSGPIASSIPTSSITYRRRRSSRSRTRSQTSIHLARRSSYGSRSRSSVVDLDSDAVSATSREEEEEEGDEGEGSGRRRRRGSLMSSSAKGFGKKKKKSRRGSVGSSATAATDQTIMDDGDDNEDNDLSPRKSCLKRTGSGKKHDSLHHHPRRGRRGSRTVSSAASSPEASDDDGEGGERSRGRKSGWFSSMFHRSSGPARPSLEFDSDDDEDGGRALSRVPTTTSSKKKRRRRRSLGSTTTTKGKKRRARSESEFDESEVATEEEEEDLFGPFASDSSSVSTSSTPSSTSEEESDEEGMGRSKGRSNRRGKFFSPFGSIGLGGGGDVGDEVFGGYEEGRSSPMMGEDEGGFGGYDPEEDGPFAPGETEPANGSVGRDFRIDGLPSFHSSSSTPSTQPIYIISEDLLVVFRGFGTGFRKRLTWWALCCVTVGIAWLVARWAPRWGLRRKGKEREMGRADKVVVETQHGDLHIVDVNTIRFPEPVPFLSVFPPSLQDPPSSRETANAPPEPTATGPTIDSAIQANGNGNVNARSHHDLTRNTDKDANGNMNGYGAVLPRSQSKESLRSSKSNTALIREVKYVDYRYFRFVLHPETGKWRMLKDWSDPTWSKISSLRNGVSAKVRDRRESLFGNNIIDIEARGLVTLLVDEVLHPFYIFQIASIILWSLDDYYFYAACIALISCISITTTLLETRQNVERMREMSLFTCPVDVSREGSWQTVDSSFLVPGDLVDVAAPLLHTFPADLVLLSGEAIVNESMLTGESVPVSKVSLDPTLVQELVECGGDDISPAMSKHVLFSGTRIVRMKKVAGLGGGKTEAVAMVLRNGFNTTKGSLVRSMLFPKPLGFKFYRDSFRFIGVLAGIAGVGFLASAVKFVDLGIKLHTIVIRALDLVTIVVPPALPATMSIGTSFSIGRLRKFGIYCISPNRVNIGGKVNMVCFDKTGTLTEDGLDVLGVRSVNRSQKKFTELHTDIDDVPIFGVADSKTPLLHALATCHAIKLVDGNPIGDPLDLRMFEFTRWTLEEGKEGASKPPASRPSKKALEAKKQADREERGVGKSKPTTKVPERPDSLVQMVVRPPGGKAFELEDALKAGGKHARFLELGVIRTFDFASSLRRMSVLVKKLKSQSVEVYVKGAPEVMTEICDKDTLPEDYDEILKDYTHRGFRVIACAAKSYAGMSWLKAQRLKRAEAESGLRFLGLLVFENKLKPGTTPAIQALRAAHVSCRMCTGDNVRTAISVAQECGMLPENTDVYEANFLQGSSEDPNAELEWVNVDDDSRHLDPYSLVPLSHEHDESLSLESQSLDEVPYYFAVTGEVFRWMIDFGAWETLQRMLVKGVVYARMSPDEKHELVERLQALGYVTSFCGDGANDCGALKAADVGISLSEAEASVAAPFTSRIPDISCVIEVIKEGRCALVTSFSCFKFMALYSLIQFTTVTLLYSIAASLGDFQFLYIDLVLIVPVAVAMGRTLPYPRLVPKRPTANLVSKTVLTSLFGQVFLTSGFQIFIYFYIRIQPWYKPIDIDPDKMKIESFENTSLFLVSCFQYLLVAAVFCVGPPYRKPLHTNTILVIVMLLLTALSTYFLFADSGPIFHFLQLVELPREFHSELLLLIILDCALAWVFEVWVVDRLTDLLGSGWKRWRKWRGYRKAEGRLYKAIERDIDDD